MENRERRFQARLAILDEQRQRALEKSFRGAFLPGHRNMVLEDYLDISLRRRQEPYPLLKLQLHLLQDLVLAEQLVSAGKEHLDQLHARLTAGDPVAKEIEDTEPLVFFDEAERRALRDLADGIAWRLFDYDRAALYTLADRQSAHHVELGGLVAEVIEFLRAFDDREGIALLNNLTHFMKLGDITIRKDANTFEIVEVKSGRSGGGRVQRQKRELDRVVTLLASGSDGSGETTTLISDFPVTPQSYISALPRIARIAARQGTTHERIGDHLVILCVDWPRNVQLGLDAVAPRLDAALATVDAWEKNGDFVMPPFHMAERYQFVRNYAPLSIFPLAPELRVRLMTGALMCTTYVNLSAILRAFERRGWSIIVNPRKHLEDAAKSEEPWSSGLVTVSRGSGTLQLPASLFGRLGYELLKPRSLIELCDAIHRRGPAAKSLELIAMVGEKQLWD